MPRFARHKLAFLAAVAYNFVFFFPLLFMGRVVSPNDVFYNFDPWAQLPHPHVQNSLLNDPPTSLLTQVALLKSGDAFNWDPYVASGIPGVGWAALISPFILIATFAVPLTWFYTVLIFLKLNVAFGFAYAWLREEDIDERGAAIGAIVVAGSGIYAVRWLWQMTNATALYPALLWLVRRTFNGKRNSIAVAILIVLSYALAGFPAAMAYGAYVVIAYAVFLVVQWRIGAPPVPRDGQAQPAPNDGQARAPILHGNVARALLAVPIALMIAAPFLATFIQFIQRTGYLGARANLSFKVFYPPHHLWSFINPQRLGNNAYKDWIGDVRLGPLNNYFEATIYVGIIALPLALIGIFARSRSRWFWLAAFVVILGAMFGAMPFIGYLPGFKYSPLSRAALLLPLPVGYFAACGASWVSRSRWRDVIAAAIAIACAFDLALFAGQFHPYLEPKTATIPTTAMIEFLHAQKKPFRVAPFFLYMWPNTSELFRVEDIRSHFSSEAIYRKMLQRVDPSSWSGTSTVIQFNSLNFNFDDPFLGLLGVRYLIEQNSIDIVKWSIFKNTKAAVDELKDAPFILKPGAVGERTVRVIEEPFYAIELPVSIEEESGRDPRLLVQLIRFGGVAWERAFTPDDIGVMAKVYIPLRPYARLGDSVTLRVQSIGVRARFLKGHADAGESQIFYGRVETPIIFDRQLPDGRVFLNVAEAPRFRVAKRIVKMSEDEFLARRDIDFDDTAVVGPAEAGAPLGDGSIHISKLTNEEQRLRTESSTPFFLASSEKLTPELQITIDGRVAHAVKINALFAGVEVPAGTHRVVFSRRIGRGWWWATIVGTLAFFCVAVLEILAVIPRRAGADGTRSGGRPRPPAAR